MDLPFAVHVSHTQPSALSRLPAAAGTAGGTSIAGRRRTSRPRDSSCGRSGIGSEMAAESPRNGRDWGGSMRRQHGMGGELIERKGSAIEAEPKYKALKQHDTE